MKENLFEENSIRTFSGKYVNLADPKPETIMIVDIAHALAHMPRWGGHLESFYSVAQHSVACSALASDEFKLEALLHDATEAFLMDIPKPLKNLLPEYVYLEHKMHKVIAEKFGLPETISPEVKTIDGFMLEKEWRELMLKGKKKDGLGFVLDYKTPALAKVHFLEAFNELMPNQTKVYEIWIEGFMIQGNSSTASLIGMSSGETFEDACKNFQYEDGTKLTLDKEYDHPSIWACKLYDNEHEARVAFG